MKRLVSVFFLTFLSICISAQTVSNVVASQEGNSIVVSYEIDKSSPEVGLTVSTDGGKTFSAPLKKVSGDVKNVQPGRRRIVWDVLAEMESFKGDNIVFNVIAKSENNHNGHEWVDLGLSVKWATCNVGASSPEGYGDYFAWGETSPKSSYDWKNLKYCTSGDSYKNIKYSKYVTESYYGSVDKKTRLKIEDDAARQNWGGKWRMPTRAEQYELVKKCTWTRITMSGKTCYKVTSKRNGNYIILPMAGCMVDSGHTDFGGDYWSSSLAADSNLAYCLNLTIDFSSDKIAYKVRYDVERCRYWGLSVRPVCP